VSDAAEFLRWCEDDALLEVRLRPASSRRALQGTQGGRLVIAVHAPPQGGRANREALEMLSRALRVPVSRLQIVYGNYARDKTILVRGLAENESARVESLLCGDEARPRKTCRLPS